MHGSRALTVLVMTTAPLAAGEAVGQAGRPLSTLALSLAAEESLPGWAIPLILAAVIAGAVALYYLARRRGE